MKHTPHSPRRHFLYRAAQWTSAAVLPSAFAQTIPNPPHTAMNLDTRTWKTVCMGRFMMKVPPDAQFGGRFRIWNDLIELRKDLTNMEQLNQEILAKQNAFKQQKHVDFGTRYIDSYNLNNKGLSVWGFSNSKANRINGRHEREAHNYFYSTKPFRVWHLKTSVSTQEGMQEELKYFQQLANEIRPLAEGEISKDFGFVIEGGLVHSDEWRGEIMGFYFEPPFFINPIGQSKEALVSFGLDTIAQGGLDPKRNVKLLDRMTLSQRAIFALTGSGVLRQRDRVLNGIEGQEFLLRERTKDDRWTAYVFRWEAQGKAKNNYEPRLTIDMSVRMPTSYEFPAPPFKSDEEALAFWDAALETFQLRPVTAQDGRQISENGHVVAAVTCSSGEACPKTGVYEASIGAYHPEAQYVNGSRNRWLYVQEGQAMGRFGLHPASEEAHVVWTWVRENRG
jgi:hypothetical protein